MGRNLCERYFHYLNAAKLKAARFLSISEFSGIRKEFWELNYYFLNFFGLFGLHHFKNITLRMKKLYDMLQLWILDRQINKLFVSDTNDFVKFEFPLILSFIRCCCGWCCYFWNIESNLSLACLPSRSIFLNLNNVWSLVYIHKANHTYTSTNHILTNKICFILFFIINFIPLSYYRSGEKNA